MRGGLSRSCRSWRGEGDKAGIAERVGYPLRVNRHKWTASGRMERFAISKQFVAEYYRLFNRGVRAAILKPDAARVCLPTIKGS